MNGMIVLFHPNEEMEMLQWVYAIEESARSTLDAKIKVLESENMELLQTLATLQQNIGGLPAQMIEQVSLFSSFFG